MVLLVVSPAVHAAMNCNLESRNTVHVGNVARKRRGSMRDAADTQKREQDADGEHEQEQGTTLDSAAPEHSPPPSTPDFETEMANAKSMEERMAVMRRRAAHEASKSVILRSASG